MAIIIPFKHKTELVSESEKQSAVMNALVKFIVAIDNSNGVISTLNNITERAEFIYKNRIKSRRDLNRFYNNLKKAGV